MLYCHKVKCIEVIEEFMKDLMVVLLLSQDMSQTKTFKISDIKGSKNAMSKNMEPDWTDGSTLMAHGPL